MHSLKPHQILCYHFLIFIYCSRRRRRRRHSTSITWTLMTKYWMVSDVSNDMQRKVRSDNNNNNNKNQTTSNRTPWLPNPYCSVWKGKGTHVFIRIFCSKNFTQFQIERCISSLPKWIHFNLLVWPHAHV